MKVCFMICGQPRCIDLVISNIENIFKNYELNFYICLTSNHENFEKEYISTFNLNNILKNNNIKKILFIKDDDNSDYRNSINYTKKIYNLINIVEDFYDFYLILRSDLVLLNINFLEYVNDSNKLYFSAKKTNQYIDKISPSIDDSIIISKRYKNIKKLSKLLYFIKKSNGYLQNILHNFIELKKIDYCKINIDYKLILSKCNIIAIAGDSGSGKSTLSNYLLPIFKNVIKLETDRYHKWERGDDNYHTYTHLNPYANHLEKLDKDIYSLKIGNEIYAVDYDHSTGKFTQEEKIESKNNIILCGLHTLYNEKTNNIIDLKIFMDTDRKLIKKWKIKRDVEERGYDIEKVMTQIEIREKDYNTFIIHQKKNADIIINFYESENLLKCKIIIKNLSFNNKIIKYVFDYNLKYEINEEIIIYIDNDYYFMIIKIIKSIFDL